MNPDRETFEKKLHRHLGLFGSASTTQLEASRARIRERLRTRQPLEVNSGGDENEIASRSRHAWRLGFTLAGAVVVIALVAATPWRHADWFATVEAADSSHYPAPAWSRAMAWILAAFERGMGNTAGRRNPSSGNRPALAAGGGQAAVQEFEEASIRQCDSTNLPTAPAGARGGGANSLQMTPGHLNVLCSTIATLIRVAYGYSAMQLDFNRGGRALAMDVGNVYGIGDEDGQRVRGGPDWVRSDRYTIEAVTGAGNPPNASTMRGPMLLRLLERRLQLQAHIEAEQIPAFALTVAKGGPKNMKKSTSADCDLLPGREGQPPGPFGYPGSVLEPPRQVDAVRRGEKPSCGMWGHRNGPNEVFIGGDVPIEALIMFLGNQLGGVRVIDKTGLTDRFNSVLEIAIDDNAPGFGLAPGPLPPFMQELASRNVPRAATVFAALEEQLGLHLERAQTPREFIVIDRVERPSPN